ncbi:MAG: hypothetical protein P3W84_000960, partial [Thermodesulfobacteriaceae bacterium]|nr:hypothetical protein [Thermodesulfobacteriaceae bacterium]
SNDIWELAFIPAYKEEQIAKILLKVFYPKGEVQEVLIFYLSGDQVKISFGQLEYNVDIPNKVFQFKIPKNTKIN